jgi:hypothetical protein
MKTLFFALFLGLILSGNVFAKKAEITSTWYGGTMDLEFVDGQGCQFACSSPFTASYHVHRDTSLGLQLLVGDDTVNLGTWLVPDDSNGTKTWYSGCFLIPVGEEWSMVWTLDNTRRDRVIDASEAWSGTCEP